MATPEPRAVGDISPDVANRSMTTAVLNAEIETLTTLKNIVGGTPVKAVFESVIGILTLVRVRLFTPSPFSHPLIGYMTRTRARKIYLSNWPRTVSKCATR